MPRSPTGSAARVRISSKGRSTASTASAPAYIGGAISFGTHNAKTDRTVNIAGAIELTIHQFLQTDQSLGKARRFCRQV
jgi:hypothetical protein